MKSFFCPADQIHIAGVGTFCSDTFFIQQKQCLDIHWFINHVPLKFLFPGPPLCFRNNINCPPDNHWPVHLKLISIWTFWKPCFHIWHQTNQMWKTYNANYSIYIFFNSMCDINHHFYFIFYISWNQSIQVMIKLYSSRHWFILFTLHIPYLFSHYHSICSNAIFQLQ